MKSQRSRTRFFEIRELYVKRFVEPSTKSRSHSPVLWVVLGLLATLGFYLWLSQRLG